MTYDLMTYSPCILIHNPLALNTYRTLHIKTHNAWQENKFSNVTVLTSEICHSQTLQDVDLLLLSGILASFLLQISLSVTAVIPRPDCSYGNRSAKPFSVHRLKLSIAGFVLFICKQLFS